MPWSWILGLGLLGYLQRSVPWVFAGRQPIPPAMVRWLSFVAPAAFTVLMVDSLGHLNGVTLLALAVAGLVSVRVRNLGVAVLVALAIGVFGKSMGIY